MKVSYKKLDFLIPIIILLQILLFIVIFFIKSKIKNVLTILCNIIILISIICYSLISKKIEYDPFKNIWLENKGSYKKVENMMNKIYQIFNKYNVKYSFAYGTLLGYARHKNLIPWDDDIDIIMDEDDIEIFKEKCIPDLINYNIISIIYEGTPGIKFKLFDSRNEKIKGLIFDYNYSWPFIDIFVYKKINEYTIFDYNQNQKISFPNTFKLKKVKMNNIYGYVPENYKLYLDLMFPNWLEDCISSEWNHRFEVSQESIQTNCKYLLENKK